ncbi:helix-turn-helix domain-containing protein [Rhodopseudomonas sp. HC1]|uniref:helix-turn-helix domain-containing protein n=1 Tax=Rhodopseudomonas infernalis TaxID=2897386 RepID=UPI001EE89E65|nr:helix-turn-helix transcriptional regulator [Rhodopseudomonas infernalis]MCG6203666.1 helix-turn-helix domain-containing protein [Rhodopseudomonas infernalis]
MSNLLLPAADQPSSRSPGDIDRQIGRLLRARRHAAGLSLCDLAAAIGVSYQQMQKYEAGANRIAASRLVSIASHLRTAPADLLPASV